MNPRADALARAFATPVEGPSYRPFTRVGAVVIVAGLFGWGGRMVAAAGPLDAGQWLAVAAIAAALLWPLPGLLRGRTVLDADGIRQPGWMGREARWVDVERVRFVRMPLSPRLMLSTGFGRAKVFYSGSRALDDAFEQAVGLMTSPLAPDERR